MPSRRDGSKLLQLKDRVTRVFESSNWIELGALTDTLDAVEKHPRLLRSLGFGDEDYEGLALTFLRKMIGPNDENLQTVLEYVERLDSGSGENISSTVSESRRVIFSPSIFQLPEESVDQRLIAVMMPLQADLNPVLGSIKSAASEAEFDCQRVDDLWDHSTVIQDIFSLIFRAFIVVCDFTGKNPNVFYEAGIAHTLGKHVVPITQNESDIPFDLKHHRYLKYLNNSEGRKKLEADLESRFLTLAKSR